MKQEELGYTLNKQETKMLMNIVKMKSKKIQYLKLDELNKKIETKVKNQKMKLLKDYMKDYKEDDFKMNVDKDGNEVWFFKCEYIDENTNEIWKYEQLWDVIDDSWSDYELRWEIIHDKIEKYKLQKLLRELDIC